MIEQKKLNDFLSDKNVSFYKQFNNPKIIKGIPKDQIIEKIKTVWILKYL